MSARCISHLVAVGIIVAAAGCFRQPKGPSAPTTDSEDCSPDGGEKPYAVPTLLARAGTYRNNALEEQNRRRINGIVVPSNDPWDQHLREARRCYSEVLQLSQDNYDAHLGMGIIYLVAADRMKAVQAQRESYLTVAKHELGRAYFIRSGPNAPLYYLAVAAVMEQDFPVALRFLGVLEKKGYQPGEVHAMLDDIEVKRGRYKEAAAHRAMVLELGASGATLQYAGERYRSRLERKAR